MGCNDNTLDFIGALVNGSDFSIPVHTLDFHPFEVSVAAKNLERIICNFERDIRGILLCHGRFHTVWFMILFHFCCRVNEKTRTADFCCHIGNFKGDSLLKSDGLSKLYTLFCVIYRLIKCSLRDAQRL